MLFMKGSVWPRLFVVVRCREAVSYTHLMCIRDSVKTVVAFLLKCR